MPTLLPTPARAKAARSRADAFDAIDWLSVWALSLGFSAIVLAGIANFAGGDRYGSMLILLGAAGIIALILNAEARPQERD